MIAGGGAGCQIDSRILDFQRAASVLPVAARLPSTVAELLDASRGMLDVARTVEEAVKLDRQGIAAALEECGALRPATNVGLAAPLPRPTNLFLHGMAYHSHARDWHADARPTLPDHPPAGFHKSIGAITGPFDPIALPTAAPDQVDFEGEICVVFGRPCHNVSAEEAMDYVAGYTILNDVSARDWIPALRSKEKPPIPPHFALNTMYKNFPTFCPLGPNVTTVDEIADFHALRMVTRLNGEIMQDATIADLIWDIPELIARYSVVNRFMPGDVMSTGTPGGVGAGRNPPRFLRAGDIVSVAVGGIGEIANPVVA